MRKALWIAVPTVGVLLFAWALWRALDSDQPHYNGRSLYTWLLQHVKAAEAGDQKSCQEAELAIRHIGTNALPTLLVWMSKRDTALKKRVLAILGERATAKLHVRQANDYYALTTYACGVLKSLAKPIVPDLAGLLKDPDPHVRSSAAYALDRIGPSAAEGIPALLESLTDGEAMYNAIQALKDIGVKPNAIVAVSIPRLASTNANERLAAMWVLAQCGTNANAAVPQVMGFLADPDLGIRMFATNTLKRIQP